MNDTAAIAQSMARHERILARVRETGSPVAEAPPFAQQLAAANPPVPIAAAPDAPVAAASRAMPGLMTAAGEPAAAPPPAETPVVSALPVELSDGQMDVLLRSLGATQVEKSTLDINKRGIQPRWMKNKSASSNITVQRDDNDAPAAAPVPKACSITDPDCEACQ